MMMHFDSILDEKRQMAWSDSDCVTGSIEIRQLLVTFLRRRFLGAASAASCADILS